MSRDGFDVSTGDLEAISRLRKWGGEKLVHEMAILFKREAPKRIRAAHQAARNGHCLASERAAHSLKSSSAQLGAVRMHATCEQMEHLAAGGHLDQIPALLHRLEHEFESFTAWLDQTITNNNCGGVQ